MKILLVQSHVQMLELCALIQPVMKWRQSLETAYFLFNYHQRD